MLAVALPLVSMAQESVGILRKGRQRAFPETVPAGNYSGIAWIGDDLYAVVSDKSPRNGFHLFSIQLDSVSGKLLQVTDQGYLATADSLRERDAEGIAFMPHTSTLMIAGEADGRIIEYTIEGKPTGREVLLPTEFRQARRNGGIESLSYNACTHRLWTCLETTLPIDGQAATADNRIQNTIRIQAFDDDLLPSEHFLYQMDAPRSRKPAAVYAMGVSELCALDDGSLIVLEREFRVPRRKLGSFVACKLYRAFPDGRPKQLLTSWRTRLNLLHRSLANYEGMCLGPRLRDGSMTLILLSDSQDQYRGILKDWFKVVILSPVSSLIPG